MPRLWGDTLELSIFQKENLKEKLEKFLLKRGKISLKALFKEFWHPYNLMSHFAQLVFLVEELAEEGKIILDDSKNLSLAKISFLDRNEIKEVTVWDLDHKKKDIEEKKKIMERYRNINPLQ